MAAMHSLQKQVMNLKAKLTAENESKNRDKMGRDFLQLDPPIPPSPLSPSGARSRPKPFNMNMNMDLNGSTGRLSESPVTIRKPFILNVHGSPRLRPQDSNNDFDIKLQEIMKQKGILWIDCIRYPTNIDELVQLGDLGNGTCGHVVKMLHKPSNKVIAVKQMRRSGNKEENKRIIMDLDVVLKSHDCPYIVRCLGCFITESDVWICMELMATCLDKLIRRLKEPIPEEILGKMAVATLKALNYLKENHGVIHRDVKPSNILLDERGTVKLCDFGISGRLVDSKAKTRSAGCAAYMAPERIDPPDPSKPDYDIRADVWSLGITLVELATGKFPYEGCKTDFEVLTKVLQEDPPLLPPGQLFSVEFCSFVKDCLTKDYKRRPKYKKLLEHPFIKRSEVANVDVASWFGSCIRQIDRKKL